MLKSDGFYQMSLETMQQFLERLINCKEERVWEAVLRWDRHHNEAQEDEKIDSDYLMDKDNGRESRLESVRHFIRVAMKKAARRANSGRAPACNL